MLEVRGTSSAVSVAVLVWLAAAAVKLMMAHPNVYRSTDFEVHRNWLAITSSLPLSQWYFDKTSEWTLDYPPLFAWFERALSVFAPLFDKGMLKVNNLMYASFETILFQRVTVVLAEALLFVALWFYVSRCFLTLSRIYSHENYTWLRHDVNCRQARSQRAVFGSLVLGGINAGIFYTDHVHFQYNGFLLGILVLSVGLVTNGHDLLGGFLFAVLVNMKHLFLSLGPIYFVFLLRHHCISAPRLCWNSLPGSVGFILRLVVMGLVVLSVFALSLGPLMAVGGMQQMVQLFSRLFPFGRGLCHAYWAPNVWVAYNLLDKALTLAWGSKGVQAANTGGLVREAQHVWLPRITPMHTVLLSLAAMLPGFYYCWTAVNPRRTFLPLILYCSLAAFLFGYHVHEKAALITAVPMLLTAFQSAEQARLYFFFSNVVHSELLPLLYRPEEWVLKVALWGLHAAVSLSVLPIDGTEPGVTKRNLKEKSGEACWLLYQIGLFVIPESIEFVQPIVKPRLTFLPLMVRSAYCLPGMLFVFWKLLLRVRETAISHRPDKEL